MSKTQVDTHLFECFMKAIDSFEFLFEHSKEGEAIKRASYVLVQNAEVVEEKD